MDTLNTIKETPTNDLKEQTLAILGELFSRREVVALEVLRKTTNELLDSARRNARVMGWAKDAYLRYGAVTEHKNFRGEPMPSFEDLSETQQAAWVAAISSPL